ncbi:MAG TPA: helix-turn-helix transcriptional regulator, partial [Micromonosporaceae bacterium]
MSDNVLWTDGPQSEQDLLLDGAALTALAHPVRVRLVRLLREHGPSTASKLAATLDLNSGATSYHLRQLATAGLVEEAEDLGNKRDRWWRAKVRALYFDTDAFQREP